MTGGGAWSLDDVVTERGCVRTRADFVSAPGVQPYGEGASRAQVSGRFCLAPQADWRCGAQKPYEAVLLVLLEDLRRLQHTLARAAARLPVRPHP